MQRGTLSQLMTIQLRSTDQCRYRRLLFGMLVALFTTPALAQTLEHVDSVKAAARRSAYAVNNATNGCPAETNDLFGWPASRLRVCEYSEDKLDGVVHLLTIEPDKVALWIETACDKLMPGEAQCFRVVLACGELNSGMMFPVSGNIIEDEKNYFFRNGVTVRIAGFDNESVDPIDIGIQRKLALKPNSEIAGIRSGLARFWRTLPRHLAAISPPGTVPDSVVDRADAQKWLDIVQSEIFKALDSPSNRLLEAYMQDHPRSLRSLLGLTTIAEKDCPKDNSP